MRKLKETTKDRLATLKVVGKVIICMGGFSASLAFIHSNVDMLRWHGQIDGILYWLLLFFVFAFFGMVCHMLHAFYFEKQKPVSRKEWDELLKKLEDLEAKYNALQPKEKEEDVTA